MTKKIGIHYLLYCLLAFLACFTYLKGLHEAQTIGSNVKHAIFMIADPNSSTANNKDDKNNNIIATGTANSNTNTKKEDDTKLDPESASGRSSALRLPNFLLAGAQTSGTSAVSDYLSRRLKLTISSKSGALVCLPDKETKEVHFFNKPDLWRKGAEYYASLWSNSKCHIRMDATPNYMSQARRIWDTYSVHGMDDRVKILFLLREPVSRELSRYNQMVNNNWDLERRNRTDLVSFEEHMHRNVLPRVNVSHPVVWSLYAIFLKDWLALFPRKNIWVASYTEFVDQPYQFLQKLHTFLDLPPLAISPRNTAMPASFLKPINNKKKWDENPSCEVMASFQPPFEPHNQRLYQLLEKHSYNAPSVETKPFPHFELSCSQFDIE